MPSTKNSIDSVMKMLRAIANGQSALREEMLKKFDEVNKKIDKVDSRVTNIGLSLANLEDDAPTREEHINLEKRVKRIEKKVFVS